MLIPQDKFRSFTFKWHSAFKHLSGSYVVVKQIQEPCSFSVCWENDFRHMSCIENAASCETVFDVVKLGFLYVTGSAAASITVRDAVQLISGCDTGNDAQHADVKIHRKKK